MVSVFIVEDEYLTRNSIKNNIDWKNHGFKFLGDASDGELALPMILQLKPDIVLTDIRMPFMDGLELTKAIRSMLPDTAIIILSGYQDFEYARQAISLGVEDYLLKPLSSQDILESFIKVRDKLTLENDMRQKHILDKSDQANHILSQRQFLRAILDGEYQHVSSILKRAQELDIMFDQKYYQVVILTTDEPVKDLSTPTILFLPSILSVHKNELEIVYILMGETPQNIEELNKELKNKIEEIHKKNPEINFNLLTGSIVTRLNELRSSYSLAKTKLYSNTKQKDQTISDFKNIDRDYSFENLKSILLFGDHEDVDSYFYSISETLDQDSFSSLIFRSYIYSSFAKTIDDFCFEYEVQKPSSLNDAMEIETHALFHKSVEHFISIAKEICLQVIEERNKVYIDDRSLYVKQAKEYLESHYSDEDISLTKVADEINLSAPYLSSIFKDIENINFTDYLISLKIDKAKKLLKTGTLRSTEISEKLGYKNPSYFSQQFKKYTGLTPSEYRDKYYE